MKEIQLTRGLVALVDDEDFEYLNQFKWYAAKDHNTFYAARNGYKDHKQFKIMMHWDIMGSKMIDHMDRDGLNCQRLNMRKCNHSQNRINSIKQSNTSSKYKGVSWDKHAKMWNVRICIDKKRKNLGYFKDETKAAICYDVAAEKYYKEFSVFNF